MTNRTLLLAAAAVLSLGAGSAFAQGTARYPAATQANGTMVLAQAGTAKSDVGSGQQTPRHSPQWSDWSMTGGNG